jgi:hypothetical protein
VKRNCEHTALAVALGSYSSSSARTRRRRCCRDRLCAGVGAHPARHAELPRRRGGGGGDVPITVVALHFSRTSRPKSVWVKI